MHQSSKVAAILVGGKGTRLRSIISDVPKPLAPIAGEPFLFILLRQLAKLGISRVVLLTGFLHKKIVAAVGDGRDFNLEIIYSEEKDPLGTAGAILQAKPHLEKFSDFILMNGDTYLDCSLESFLQFPLPSSAIGLIGAMQPLERERFGSLEIDAKNNIKAFLEKGQHKTNLVNAGIYRLSPAIFNNIPANQFASLETDIFPALIKKELSLQAFPLQGEFVDIGVPESYSAFNHKMTQLRGIKQCD